MLDDKDLEFINALRSLKVPRWIAVLIAYLVNTKEATSREIESATGLRQSEVSIGMSKLREKNWIIEREIKKEGKGRPKKIYSLSIPIEKIIEYFEVKKTGESARAMLAIQKLKEMKTN
jgi:predicted transcriptional regulator